MLSCLHTHNHLLADLQLTDLSFASQRAQLRRSSSKMLSVSQGGAQLHFYLKRKTLFSDERSKHTNLR